MSPSCVSTVTISPTDFPISACPTGDSLEIFPSRLFASVEPTILNSISSSNVMSNTLTVHPTLILSKSTSSSTTTSAFFRIPSSSSIRASISLCSSFAASYSAFSERSPCSLASLILAATSFLFTTLRSSSSSSSAFNPALVSNRSFASGLGYASFLFPSVSFYFDVFHTGPHVLQHCHLSLFRNFNIITTLYNDVKRFSSSSRLSTAFTFSLRRADPFSPFVYQATCFLISRIPENSPLYSSCRRACLSIIFRTSSLSGLGGSSPVSSQCIISENIHGLP